MIYHILPESDWTQAQRQGEYRAASLATEGFIHFSKREQLVRVANFHFKGKTGLIILKVDENKLEAPLKYEAIGTPEPYPHLYGALNLDAIVGTVTFPANADGSFSLPEL